jgi:hypothetical protein
MRIVCVICTEILVSTAHISVCSCGHLFHEECIYRWLKTSKQTTCPQCRAKISEKTMVKRLFMTDSNDTGFSQSCPEVVDENGARNSNTEFYLQKIDNLKNRLSEIDEEKQMKTKVIEKVN